MSCGVGWDVVGMGGTVRVGEEEGEEEDVAEEPVDCPSFRKKEFSVCNLLARR